MEWAGPHRGCVHFNIIMKDDMSQHYPIGYCGFVMMGSDLERSVGTAH